MYTTYNYCINCGIESKHLVQVTRETGEEMLISICDPDKEDCRAVADEHADGFLDTREQEARLLGTFFIDAIFLALAIMLYW